MDIVSSSQCESEEVSKLGLACTWGKNNLNEEICAVKNSLECDDYLTISGCSWSVIGKNDLRMLCEWNKETTSQCGNSKECGRLMKEGLIVCEDYTSEKGPCFFNGESSGLAVEKPCSDVVDIISCDLFLSVVGCTYANRSLFMYLPSNLELPCTWNVENKKCEPKEEKSNEDGLPLNIIIIIIVVVFISLIIVVLIIVIILYRRKLKAKAGNVTDPDIKMSDVLKTNPSLRKKTQRTSGFYYFI
jgi:hypothetical protein